MVRELGLGDSSDTLGRWLAHELAEVMHRAEHGESEEARAAARLEAARLVATLWRRRRRLRGRAYPLAPIRRLLATVSLFGARGDARWWRATEGDRAVAALFQGFARLMAALLLLRIAPGEPRLRTQGAAFDMLTADEQGLLQHICAWLDAADASGARRRETETAPVAGTPDAPDAVSTGDAVLGEPHGEQAPQAGGPPVGRVDREAVRRAAVQWIDLLLEQLAQLRRTLDPPPPAGLADDPRDAQTGEENADPGPVAPA